MISGLVYIEIFTLSDFREHASNRTDVKGKNVVVSGFVIKKYALKF